MPISARAAAAVLAATALLSACNDGSGPSADPPATRPPSAASPTASPRPVLPSLPLGGRPSVGPATPVFGEQTAVPCNGYPTGEQILAMLRRTTRLLPASATATFRTGPLCAGTWQYSVVLVPEHDPLEVVTRGAPSSLRLVTAGTDVCTIDVRATAPPGIRAMARC